MTTTSANHPADLTELRELIATRKLDQGARIHIKQARKQWAAGTFTREDHRGLRLHLLQLPLIPAEHAPF